MIRYEICQLFIIHWEHNSVTGVVPAGAVEIAAHIVQLAGWVIAVFHHCVYLPLLSAMLCVGTFHI